MWFRQAIKAKSFLIRIIAVPVPGVALSYNSNGDDVASSNPIFAMLSSGCFLKYWSLTMPWTLPLER